MGIDLPNPRNVFLPKLPDNAELPEVITHLNELTREVETDFAKLFDDIKVVADVASTSTATGGDVYGPATNTLGNVPQWIANNSKTLTDGLGVSTSAAHLVVNFSTLSTNTALATADIFVVAASASNYDKSSVTFGVLKNSILGGNCGFANVAVYATPGSTTFTKPDGVSIIFVEGVGGGGSNGCGAVEGGAAGGGGYFNKVCTISTNVDIIVGSGGAALGGDNPGTAGFATVVGTFCTGGGGGGADHTSLGAGGVAVGGDININGQAGSKITVATASNSFFWKGGGSFLGEGEFGSALGTGVATAMGYGGGAAANVGRHGKQGIVIIRW